MDEGCIKNTLFLHLNPVIKKCLYEAVSQCVDAPCLLGQLGHLIRVSVYRVVIDNHILPFMNDVRGGSASVVLQEDNCGSQRAKYVATYLTNK